MCVQICILLCTAQDIWSDVKLGCRVNSGVARHKVDHGCFHECDLPEQQAHMEDLQQQVGKLWANMMIELWQKIEWQVQR